ncbi:hypothetical protein, partial [Acinetobacter baumannii]|uniref:hypothetical protein n=1 Tax=Acinetobacter baumannii TaxID=470 RepID=UPI0027EAE8DE
MFTSAGLWVRFLCSETERKPPGFEMPVWLKNPVEVGQGGSAPLRTSFSDEEKLSSANYLI